MTVRERDLASADTVAQAIAAILHKLAKHLALIGCLMIVSVASGRADFRPVTVFCAIALAALLHGTGGYLRHRLLRKPSPLRSKP